MSAMAGYSGFRTLTRTTLPVARTRLHPNVRRRHPVGTTDSAVP